MRQKEVVEKWRQIFEEVKASGVCVRRWCAENGISSSTYYYWHKQLRILTNSGSSQEGSVGENRSDGPLPVANAPVFAEVQMGESPISSEADGYSVLLGKFLESQIVIQHNHSQIFVGKDFSSHTLERVMEVIGNVT